jgi:hypothetical protein
MSEKQSGEAAPEAKAEKKDAPSAAGQYAFTGGPPLPLRALLGFAGLALLVGFFLPWFRAAAEGEHESGMTMMLGAPVAGTPAIALVAVPVLGALLSAAAFMGLRWTAHVAIGVAASLLGFGLWVLVRLFVEHTAIGLWLAVGGAFVILLLGVVSLILARDRAPKKDEAAASAPEKS